MQPQAQKPRTGRIVISLCIVAVISLGFWQRQNILDAWALRGYEPSVKITALATNAGMSDKGRKIFYVTHPEVQDKAAFYKSCEEGETSVVLGCYKPRDGIYLLRVDDARLAGVEEVTAAHEMLHAAYARLSFSEKKRLTNLINDTYNNLTDPTIDAKVKLYKESGADVTNELHSILGSTSRIVLPW